MRKYPHKNYTSPCSEKSVQKACKGAKGHTEQGLFLFHSFFYLRSLPIFYPIFWILLKFTRAYDIIIMNIYRFILQKNTQTMFLSANGVNNA